MSNSRKQAQKRNGKRNAKSSRAETDVRIFRGIGELYTFSTAAQKEGRKATADDLGYMERAAIVAREGRVFWVGKEKDLPKKFARAVEVDDFGGACVVPAFVESHTHLVFAGNRAGEFERRNQGESYQSIAKRGGGILATVNATRQASVAQLAAIGRKRAVRFLRQGVTTIEVKSGYALTVEDELKMLRAAGRVRRARIVRTFLGAHAIPQEFSSADEYVDHLIDKALPAVRDEGLACRVDIFIENGYFSKDLGKRYLQAAKEMGFDVVVHADQLTRSGGAELALEMKARSAEHLVRINDSDVKRLAASQVTCVLLPSADLYMKCDYPPARKLIDAGARVALATDFNPGTAPSQDLALVGVLARLEMKMTLPEVLVAYTVGGAHALGLQKELGSIEPGKLCDFSVLTGGIDELFLEVGHMPIGRVYREGLRAF